jgi:hypothetical protein
MLLDVNYVPEDEYAEGRSVPARIEITIPNNDPYSETGLMQLGISIEQARTLQDALESALDAYMVDATYYPNDCEYCKDKGEIVDTDTGEKRACNHCNPGY